MSMLVALATDDVGVTKVQFFAETTLLGESLTAPFGLTFDAATLTNGAHLLTAKAFDAAGNSTTSDAVPVVVGAAGPVDLSPPVVSISTPRANAKTGLQVQVSAAATDDLGVTRVELEVDGVVVATMTSAPYTAAIDVAAGQHTVVAIAWDAAGKFTRSSSVSFSASKTAASLPSVNPRRDLVGGCGCNSGAGAPFAVGLFLLGLAHFGRRRSRFGV